MHQDKAANKLTYLKYTQRVFRPMTKTEILASKNILDPTRIKPFAKIKYAANAYPNK